jgi:hypothetical protein
LQHIINKIYQNDETVIAYNNLFAHLVRGIR